MPRDTLFGPERFKRVPLIGTHAATRTFIRARNHRAAEQTPNKWPQPTRCQTATKSLCHAGAIHKWSERQWSNHEFRDKTAAPNQMWQTDFTYLKVTGWGWFYLSTVLDDFSRDIVGWKLCTSMWADDVSATLDIALGASGCDRVTVLHKPRLLSDNGPCYIAGDLAEDLERHGMDHVRGAPNHPRRRARSNAGLRPSRT